MKNMKLSFIRKHTTDFACILIPAVIYVIPGIICYSVIEISNKYISIFSLIISPIIYALVFAITAGIISVPFHRGIIPGKFPRVTSNLVYSMRKIYGTSWTTIFYCKPVYFLILNTPFIRKITFRLFGYKENLDFRIYPDCWIRDLCILEFGKNSYLASGCTLGTNVCQMDGTIAVNKITIGENSIIGSKVTIALGAEIGSNTEIGIETVIGINSRVGNFVKIKPMCKIGHFTQIGNNVEIGADSFIGKGAIISDNIRIPDRFVIPDKAIITTMDDINNCVKEKHSMPLKENRETVFRIN